MSKRKRDIIKHWNMTPADVDKAIQGFQDSFSKANANLESELKKLVPDFETRNHLSWVRLNAQLSTRFGRTIDQWEECPLNEVVAIAQEVAKLEAKQSDTESDTIPVEFRSIPLAKNKAVKLFGWIGDESRLVDRLSKDIDGGRYRVIEVSRQRFIFDVRDFPFEAQERMRPKPN